MGSEMCIRDSLSFVLYPLSSLLSPLSFLFCPLSSLLDFSPRSCLLSPLSSSPLSPPLFSLLPPFSLLSPPLFPAGSASIVLWILDGDNISLQLITQLATRRGTRNARSQHSRNPPQPRTITTQGLITQSVAVQPPPLLHAERGCGGTPNFGIARTPWA